MDACNGVCRVMPQSRMFVSDSAKRKVKRMSNSRPCMWCRIPNPYPSPYCGYFGHAAHKTPPRCDCERCLQPKVKESPIVDTTQLVFSFANLTPIYQEKKQSLSGDTR